MAKKLLVMLLALLLISAVSYASVNKRNIDNTPVIIKQSPNLTKGHIITSLADPLIWEDNFEGTNPMWIPDASWNHVEGTQGGRGYQPKTSWSYLEEGGNHYWNASEKLDQELDFLVSPPIKLPIELTSDTGAKMPLKGLKIDYQLKGTVNDGSTTPFDAWHHLLGPSESVWGFDNTAPGAGTSSWFCDYNKLSSAYHWRQWLLTPDVNLTGSTGSLTFKHAYAVEPEFDYIAVDISTDNFLTYTNLGFWGQIAGGKEDWKDITIDIAAWTGKTVKIRWSSKGDYGTAVTGWWVDAINVGGVFKDDGGETGATQMTTAGFTGGNISTSYFGGDYIIGTTLNDWLWASAGYASFPLEVTGFGTNFGPDSEVRMAFQWISDGDTPVGNGLCLDNFKLLGIGKPDKDIAVLGANTLNAKLGADFSPTIYFLNNGILTATGAFVWTGTIYNDAATKVTTLFGQAILNVKSDSVFTLKPAKAWIPELAGVYTLKVAGSYQGDKDLLNDSLTVDFWVPGAPWSEVLWREDFDTNPIATSLEDLGFTVVNGGGDAHGNNLNTWEYSGGLAIYGWGPLISAFWGNIDPGVNTTDSSEVLDESLITPPIDITSLGKNNTLHVNLYTYYRSGYPGAAYTDFGVATSELSYQVSLDGTKWMEFFYWVDKDGLPGNGPRLPNFRFPDRTLPYTAKLEFDLTPILAYREAGQNKVWLKFNLKCKNSWFVALTVDEMLVYAGIGAPVIKKVVDVPQDQGKQVQLVWKAYFPDLMIWDDAGNGIPVTHYTIWRADLVTAANAKPVADLKAMFANSSKAKVGDQFVTLAGEVWTYLGMVPAHSEEMYAAVVPTLWDKVKTSFKVSAQTALPDVFMDSKPLMGESVDNLAPVAATNLKANTSKETVTLSWDASYSPDVQHYTIYRNGKSVGTTPTLAYSEKLLDGSYTYYVTATDFGGNEGLKSNDASVTVTTAVNDFQNGVPTEFAMYQNYPNPFNPVTYINYSIPKASFVTIKIYNASGQEVASLVNQEQPVGNYNLSWNAGGMSSGLYFYTITAGDFSQTMKMILMK